MTAKIRFEDLDRVLPARGGERRVSTWRTTHQKGLSA
jgi:hypothetical protein